jgi:hypothetical protein
MGPLLYFAAEISASWQHWSDLPNPSLLPDGRIFGQITQEALKNCPLPQKIGGRKMAKFGKKWQKRGRKIFLQLFSCETI